MTTVAVLGLDLSLTRSGYALPNGVTGLLRPGARVGMERLGWIVGQVECLLDDQPPHVVVVEGYSFGSHSSHAHELGELGGVVRYLLWRRGTAFVNVAPASLKRYAAGRGNATKADVLAEAIRRLGYQGSDDNVADSLWLREIGLWMYADPRAVQVPAAHLTGVRALSALPWPELVPA